MKSSGDYFVTVIEDTRKNEIIGSATLVVENKFIHECGSVSTDFKAVVFDLRTVC